MESWLKSHTHKRMICECGHIKLGNCKVHVHSKWMFVCYASRCIQNFYHLLLCIENSTNYKSLLLTVSFHMLSLRWDSPEASWDLRIFRSSSISRMIFSYLFLISALLCKLVIRICPLSHTHPWGATALSKNSNPYSMQLSIFRLETIEKYHTFVLDLSFI